MPSAVSLPTFSHKEKLTYQKLNAAMDAIQARFTAGIGAADLSWPLTAEGNLDMSSYNIVNGRQIWGYVNAASYTTFALAVAAAGAGGVVLVPPDTTITSDGGVDFSNLGAIIGSGPSSVLKLSSGTSATELIKATAGTYVMLSNLTLDGTSVASKIGVDLQGVTSFVGHNLWFKNFGGAAFKASASCDGVFLTNCWFSGGAGDHIYVTHSGALGLTNVHSSAAAGIGIRMEAAGASSYIYALLNNVRVTGGSSTAIKMLGTAAPGSANPVEFYGNNIKVSANSGGVDAVILGTASAGVHHVSWSDGRVVGAAAGGVLVNASEGSVTGVVVNDPATYGIDLDVSQYVSVSDCTFRACTIGIDGSAATAVGCTAHDNKFESCTTNIAHGVGLRQYDNAATWSVPGPEGYTWAAQSHNVGPLTAQALRSVTIPANMLRAGDVIEIVMAGALAGQAATPNDYISIQLNGVTMSSITWGGIGNYHYTTRLVVTSSSTVAMSVIGVDVGASRYGQDDSISGLDFTAAQVLRVLLEMNENGTSAQTMDINFHTVRFYRLLVEA